MVSVVSDLAETALGPWGVAVALGVGLLAARRRRPAVTVPTPVPANPVVATPSRPIVAAGGAVVGQVRARLQRVVVDAGDYWRDLYAEAHHEWEEARAGRAAGGSTVAVVAAGPVGAAVLPTVVTPEEAAPPAVVTPEAAAPASKRVRGPNGRYVKTTG